MFNNSMIFMWGPNNDWFIGMHIPSGNSNKTLYLSAWIIFFLWWFNSYWNCLWVYMLKEYFHFHSLIGIKPNYIFVLCSHSDSISYKNVKCSFNSSVRICTGFFFVMLGGVANPHSYQNHLIWIFFFWKI